MIADIFVPIITMLLALTATSFVSWKLTRNQNMKSRYYKDKVFQTIDKKLDAGLIENKKDVEIILNSFTRENEESYILSVVLEDYLNYKLQESETLNKEKLRIQYDLFKKIIEEENKDKPFANLPNEERRLLVGINDALKYNDLDSIKFNLNELHSVISTRSGIYEKTSRINKWSVPLAIIGTFFTVLFGVLSIIPNRDLKEMEEINKSIMEKMDNIITPDTIYFRSK